jgi:hypothetical protein
MPTPSETFLREVHRLQSCQKIELQQAIDQIAELRKQNLNLAALLQRTELQLDGERGHYTKLLAAEQAHAKDLQAEVVSLSKQFQEQTANLGRMQRDHSALIAVVSNLQAHVDRSPKSEDPDVPS